MTAPLNNLTDTWNNGATVFTGLKYNITDTASDAASMFLDFQIATVSKFSILKTGKILLPNGTSSATSIQKAGFPNTGIFFVSGQFITSIAANGIVVFSADTASVNVNAVFQISGSTSAQKIQISDGAAYSIAVYGEATGCFAIRNDTTNAITLRAYNTFTDSSNWERGVFDWTTSSNVLSIGTQALGTGTLRQLRLYSGTSIAFYVDTAAYWGVGNGLLVAGASAGLTFGGTIASGAVGDVGFTRQAAGILGVTTGDYASTALRALKLAALWRTPTVTKTADFTVADSDSYLINNKSGSTCTVTLPAAASYAGREIIINNYQTQTVVSNASNVVPQAGGSAGTAILAATAGKWALLVSDATNWIIMESN